MTSASECLSEWWCSLGRYLNLHLVVEVRQHVGIADHALLPVVIDASSELYLGRLESLLDVDDDAWVQRWAATMLLVHRKVRYIQDLLLEQFLAGILLAFEHVGDGVDGVIRHPFAGAHGQNMIEDYTT